MKSLISIIVVTACMSCTAAFADGQKYTVRVIAPSHVARYSADDFYVAHQLLERRLIDESLVLWCEAFIVPSGPGYRVVIGQKDAGRAITSKEVGLIESYVRDALMEARKMNQEQNKSGRGNGVPHQP